jgi:hypothetical protein
MEIKNAIKMFFQLRPKNPPDGKGLIYFDRETGKPVWQDKNGVHGFEGTQVQADWGQGNEEEPDFIKNKPALPAAQVQADWEQEDEEAVDFIKNKPSIASSEVFHDETLTGKGSEEFPLSVVKQHYVIDPKDGKYYPVKKMPDGKWWFMTEYSYEGAGFSFWTGYRHYGISEITGIIPSGWKLPERDDFKGLDIAFGFNGSLHDDPNIVAKYRKDFNLVNNGGYSLVGNDEQMMNPGGVWLMGAMTGDDGYAALSRYVYQSGSFGNLITHYSVNPEDGLGVNNRAGVRFIVTNEQLILEEEKIQTDWMQSNSAKPDYIRNKPTIPAAQVQVDWEQDDEEEPDFIKNKPVITVGSTPPTSGVKDGDIFIKTS